MNPALHRDAEKRLDQILVRRIRGVAAKLSSFIFFMINIDKLTARLWIFSAEKLS